MAWKRLHLTPEEQIYLLLYLFEQSSKSELPRVECLLRTPRALQYFLICHKLIHSFICSVGAICQALWLQRESCLSPHPADSPPRNRDLKHNTKHI